jgi:protein RecA
MLIGGNRLPDGSFVCPGWPKGTIIEIIGRESSGKSTIALTAMGQAIQHSDDGCGLYVDLEHAVKDNYAAKLGVDFRPTELGGSGRAVRVAPHTFEETESLVMAAALNGISMVVIDSVAGLVSRREIMRNVADAKQKEKIADIPLLMSKFMPKLQSVIARTKTIVIFLNQTRDKIGAIGHAEETLKSTTGGNALKFWAALRFWLKPRMVSKAKIFNPLLNKIEEVPISTDIEVKSIKNKIDAKQGHSGLITLRYGVGIDELRTMLNVAIAYNIIRVKKNSNKQDVYMFNVPEQKINIEAIGIEKFRIALSANQQAFKYCMDMCTNRIIEGFRAIDDEQLSELAENAVTTNIYDEDSEDSFESDQPQEEVVVEEDASSVDAPTIDIV